MIKEQITHDIIHPLPSFSGREARGSGRSDCHEVSYADRTTKTSLQKTRKGKRGPRGLTTSAQSAGVHNDKSPTAKLRETSSFRLPLAFWRNRLKRHDLRQAITI